MVQDRRHRWTDTRSAPKQEQRRRLPRGNGKYLLSYIACAPASNPEVVIYVVIDEPNTEVQADSSLVLGLSKAIMEEAFPYLGITTIEESQETLETEGQAIGDTDVYGL